MGSMLPGNKYSEAVAAHVAPSLRAAALLAALGGASLALMTLIPMGVWMRMALGSAILLSTLDAIRVAALRLGPRGVRAFRLERSGSLRVRDAAGREREGRVREGSFVAPWLTLVRWRPEGARRDRTFLLLPGMLDDEAFRRLRVLLRWQ